MAYVTEMNKMIIKGIFVKKGFFQGPPIENAIKVHIYMKFENKNITLVSGDTFKNYYSYMYLNLLISKPPVASQSILSLNRPDIAKIIEICPNT